MNDFAMYQMYSARRVDLEREARESALVAEHGTPRRRWHRRKRASAGDADAVRAGSTAAVGAGHTPIDGMARAPRQRPADYAEEQSRAWAGVGQR